MQRVRISAQPHPTDYQRLSRIRKHLYAYSAVAIDPENPAYAVHRGADGRAYFELSTDRLDEVRRVLEAHGHAGYAVAEPVAGVAGEPCLNCGFIAGEQPPATCPRCGFQETSACPHCHNAISRKAY